MIFAATVAAAIFLMKNKNNSSVPAATQEKAGSNFEIAKETVPKNVVKPPQKNGVGVQTKSTKEIVAGVPKQIQGRLVRLIFKKMPLGENKNLTNTLILVYYDDAGKKTTEADYVFATGIFAKNPKAISVSANMETVPEPVIDLGYEGMRGILLASTEYQKYRSKYPELLGNCSATLVKNKQYGWEWITACSSLTNGKKSSVAFVTNFDTKKVSVIKKENLE
jgi:hypothetical protein